VSGTQKGPEGVPTGSRKVKTTGLAA
jgi:hypothetical protein